MPRYALFGKYTPAGLAGVRESGYATREAHLRETWAQIGGTLESWSWLDSTEFDFMQIVEAPSSDSLVAALHMTAASGAFERAKYYELRSSAQADATLGPQSTWRAPSQR